MSLTVTFNGTQPAANYRNLRKKRKPPFSVRLNDAERVKLAELAKGRSLSAFVKERVFSDAAAIGRRRSGVSVQDREALARVLAALGASRLASNINQLARLANTGSLPLTPEVIEELRLALQDIRSMRKTLLMALGLKPEGAAI